MTTPATETILAAVATLVAGVRTDPALPVDDRPMTAIDDGGLPRAAVFDRGRDAPEEFTTGAVLVPLTVAVEVAANGATRAAALAAAQTLAADIAAAVPAGLLADAAMPLVAVDEAGRGPLDGALTGSDVIAGHEITWTMTYVGREDAPETFAT
jgi:hypothetical protein